jgi:hypothetical protein
MLTALLLAMLATFNAPPPGSPVLVIESLGCTMCQPGQVAEIRASISNPGGQPRTVRLIAAASVPGDSGTVEITLFDGPVQLTGPVTRLHLFGPRTVIPADQPGMYLFVGFLAEPQGLPFTSYVLRAEKVD